MVRINRYLAERGLCSRREADRLVCSGKVTVNGKVASIGMRICDFDDICVEGKSVKKDHIERIVIAFNKPRGIVCTSSDKDGAQNIIDFIGYGERIFPIGRLDKDSEGLILLTNRGELVNLVNKSSGLHEKEYLVSCCSPVSDGFLRKMEGPLDILVPVRGGVMKKVKTMMCPVKRKNGFSFYITLKEGYNRQIRRMCETLHNKADTIKRIRVMNIHLGDLAPGKYRLITGSELKKFERELGL